MTAELPPGTIGLAHFRFSPPVLWAATLSPDSEPEKHGEDPASSPDLELGFALRRLTASAVGYEFVGKVEVSGVLVLEARFRSVFEFGDEDGEVADESIIRTVLARNAPAAIYPFFREFARDIVGRATTLHLNLPVVNFQSLWEPEVVKVPAWEPEADSPAHSD
jgi:preprotein translocase subunit SecB